MIRYIRTTLGDALLALARLAHGVHIHPAG